MPCTCTISERHLHETISAQNPLQGCGIFYRILEMTWILSFAFASLSTFLKLWWLVGAKTLALNPKINFYGFGIVTNIMNLNLSANKTTRQLILVYNGSFIHIIDRAI